jgi:hypothetical protein
MSKRRHTQGKDTCPYCGEEWNTMGLSSHVRSCKRKHEDRLHDAAYNERLRRDLELDASEVAEVPGESHV